MRHSFLAAAALATLATFAGCAKQSSRPFENVDQTRYESTDSIPDAASQRATPTTRPTIAELPTATTQATDPQGRPVGASEALVPSTTQRTPVAPTLSAQLRPIQLQVTPDGQLLRPWPESVSYRVSGDTLAGPTYWPTSARAYQRNGLTNIYMEPAEYLVNSILLPFKAILVWPQTPVIYSPINRVGGEP